MTVLDDLSTGHADAVPDGAAFVPGDLAERAGAVLADGDPYDGVLHFAAKALVGESVEHPERYWRTNVAGTLALLDAMRANAVPRLVFSSTAATYGEPDGGADRGDRADPADQPVRRLEAGRGHDDHVRGAGARARRGRACATSTWPARPAAQGERHSPETHIIPIALQVVAGRRPAFAVYGTDYPTPDGTCIRDYVHVDDLAEAHLLALAAAAAGEHRIYNLGNGAGFSVLRRGRGGAPGDRSPAADRGRPAPARRPGRAGRVQRADPGGAGLGARASPRSTRWSPTRGSSSSPAGDERAARSPSGHGAAPARSAWRAPGRLNLIGEHTDYNDGYVLPLALPYATTAAVTARTDGVLRLRSAQRGDAELPVADLAPGSVDGWAAYVAGVVWALRRGRARRRRRVRRRGGRRRARGRRPVLLGRAGVLGRRRAGRPARPRRWTGPRLARLAQRAENDFVGMPSGVMDQMASMLCTEAHALFLDCRSLATEQVPFDPAAAGLAVLGVDSRSPHQLTDGAYAERRAVLRAGRADPGRAGAAGRDRGRPGPAATASCCAGPGTWSPRTSGCWRTVAALHAGRVADIGPLLSASHASMRDDFEITVPRVDLIAATAEAAGALGARMTGGGFGGCVLALAPVDRVGAVRAAITDAYDRGRVRGSLASSPRCPRRGARRIG